jgi:hypothetical protein
MLVKSVYIFLYKVFGITGACQGIFMVLEAGLEWETSKKNRMHMGDGTVQ